MLKRIRKAVDDGFTLIELLIVIIILGILAAIVVFAIGQTRGDAVAASCKTTVKQIALAAEAVKTHEGSYGAPASLADKTKGGLLKTAPPVTTDNYVITYAATDTDATHTGTGYTITTSQAAGKTVLASPGAYSDTSADSVLDTVCKSA
jgi:general secretion pathway protein G